MGEYNLKVVGYVCKYCSLLTADLGPASKTQLKIETIDVPCAGKVDQKLLLAPFEEGADAVFLAGCPEHHCTSVKGSARARKRLLYMAKLLDEIGVGGKRLVMYNVAGTEGPRFSQIITDMENLLQELGPSPLNRKTEPSTTKVEASEQSVQKDGEVCA
jgi:F420-non-reducing hydrogenase iron-sulfur subunit